MQKNLITSFVMALTGFIATSVPLASCEPRGTLGFAEVNSLTAPNDPSESTSRAGIIGAADAASTQRYYPVKSFFSWTYAVTIKSPTQTISAEDKIRVESLSGSNPLTGTLSYKRFVGGNLEFDGSGSLSQSPSAIVITINGASQTISLPLTIGKEWTSGTLNARSFAVAKLTVGGKTYEDLIGISFSRDGEVVAVWWLAPKVGIVKQVTRTRDGSKATETVSELTNARTIAVTKVTLSPAATFSLTVGATADLSAVAAMDEDAPPSQEISYSVDKPSILSVAKGATTQSGLKATVTAIAAGTATVTARSDQDPTKSASLAIEVK